jgi:diguanylate cyclase (GGDEF)-like protein
MRRGELAARLGGDEFAIVATYIADGANAVFARKIIRELSAPYTLACGLTVRVGVSIGIALARPGEVFESTLKRADAALYEAKSEERGAFRFADRDGDAAGNDEQAVANAERGRAW